MKRRLNYISRLSLILVILLGSLSSGIALSDLIKQISSVSTDSAPTEVSQDTQQKKPKPEFVFKQATFEAVIPFASFFIPQGFYEFLIVKPVYLVINRIRAPQVELSLPSFLRNIYSNIIASNAP